MGDGYFCTTNHESSCTYNRAAIGSCEFRSWSAIPAKYAYFTDGTLGGVIEIADYCPFSYPVFGCDEKGAVASHSTSGDAIGATSRCFDSTVTKLPLGLNPTSTPKCYPHLCPNKTTLAVKVGSYWYVCPDGGKVDQVIGYNGGLHCPRTSLLCDSQDGQDTKFPVYCSVEPERAKAGDKLRIAGKNLGTSTKVTVGAACENVQLDSTDGSITCTIATTSAFSTQVGLKDLVLEQNGYALAVPAAFTLDLDIAAWVADNWFFLFAILLCAVVLILAVIIVAVKMHHRKRDWQKVQKQQQQHRQSQQALAASKSDAQGTGVAPSEDAKASGHSAGSEGSVLIELDEVAE